MTNKEGTVKPQTDTEHDQARRGLCIWQVGYGLPWTIYCPKKARRGHLCGEHERDRKDLAT